MLVQNQAVGFLPDAGDGAGKHGAEEALRASDERYRELVENARDIIYSHDLEGNFTSVNMVCQRILGYSADEFLRMSTVDILTPEDLRIGKRMRDRKLHGGEASTVYEVEFIARDGRRVPVEVNTYLTYKDGVPAGIQGIARDITERRRAEAERRVIFEVIDGFNTTSNLEEFLHLVHKSIRKVLYAENCFVALYDARTNSFKSPFYVNQRDNLAPPEKTAKGFTGHVFRTGVPLRLTPSVLRERVAGGETEIAGTSAGSWLGVPLKTSTETIGVLVVQHYDDEEAYSTRDVEFLSSIGGQIALAISRKLTEEALKESEEKFRSFVETTGEWIWAIDRDGRMTYNNPAIESILGYRTEELLGRNAFDFMHHDERTVFEKMLPIFTSEKRGWSNVVLRWQHRDGSYRCLESSAMPILQTDGTLLGYRGTDRDITERIRMEEALRESDTRFRSAFGVAPIGMALVGTDGRWLQVNRSLCEIVGYNEAELLATDFQSITHPDDLDADLEYFHQMLDGIIDTFQMEKRYIHKRGHHVWILLSVSMVRDASLEPLYFISQIQDITARRNMETALRESETKYRTLVESMPTIAMVYRAQPRPPYSTIYVSPNIESLGYELSDWYAKPDLWVNMIHPDDREWVLQRSEEALESGHENEYEYRIVAPDGSVRWLHDRGRFVRDGEGNPTCWQGILLDITERKRAQEAVIEANRRAIIEYERLLEKISSLGQGLGTARDLITAFRHLRDFALSTAHCDALLISLFDRDKNERTITYAWADGHEIDVTHLPSVPVTEGGFVGRAINTQTVGLTDEYQKLMEGQCIDTPNSKAVPQSALVAPMTLKAHTVGVVEILSYEHAAFRGEHRTAMQMAANLAAIAIENVRLFEREREKEELLRQSQKMEAVGKLAGGVAHDFNNLLTAITGYSALSLRKLSPEDPIHRNIEEIKKAGDRAAGLTRQLLAFSRKQVLQPKVLNLNGIVADISKMLQRLIGEDVALLVKPDPTLGQIKADPSQLEQVLVNLAVNARDAMPMGGTLTVETGNVYLDPVYASRHVAVTPGHYVMLAVSDTGHGMDEATQTRVFEPFFTTKEVGKGTGLGLSTVYGIIKQSGGNIWVYSELNLGTTLKIYLPRVDDLAEIEYDDRGPVEFIPRGTETILLVEDEAMVREMTTEVLRESGYHVLVARHGAEALDVADGFDGPVHLLLSDVVMPQMSGRELVERLTPKRPKMRVLYMSGYTDDAILHHGVLDPGTEFIEKPFTPESIVRKVRDLLDE